MKSTKSAAALIVACAAIAPFTTQAATWMDAFAKINILRNDETNQGDSIQAGLGETLKMRVALDDAVWQDYFKNSLSTTIIATDTAGGSTPTIEKITAGADATILQEFNVNIPLDFITPNVLESATNCRSFVIRASFNASRTGYNVIGSYVKERNINVCPNFQPTPVPPIAANASPTPDSNDPALLRALSNGQSSLNKNSSEVKNGDIQGSFAACSRTVVGQSVKTVVAAIPVVGMAPIAFSFASMTTAFFAFDRRRPEHWVKVVDSLSGKGVGGAVINIYSADGKVCATWTSEAKTGNTGDLLQPGQYEFSVQKQGFSFPSMEEPLFPLQQGEFIYRAGPLNLNRPNVKPNA